MYVCARVSASETQATSTLNQDLHTELVSRPCSLTDKTYLVLKALILFACARAGCAIHFADRDRSFKRADQAGGLLDTSAALEQDSIRFVESF